jgi:hypothetical protein
MKFKSIEPSRCSFTSFSETFKNFISSNTFVMAKTQVYSAIADFKDSQNVARSCGAATLVEL